MSESIEMSTNLLSESYALSAAQISEYRESGAVRLPGVLDGATLDGVRETIRRLTREGARATVPLEERDTYGRAFTQVFNLWRRDAAARAFALSSRLARVATELMGCAGVRMYHDQALIPLKALEFDQGVNMTLGLPLIRTSPDHGTAFDIAGSKSADPGAMIAALEMAGSCLAARAHFDG